MIWCDVFNNAANAVAANSGVPAKMIFTNGIQIKLIANYKRKRDESLIHGLNCFCVKKIGLLVIS
jgi:hypothetical protein